MSWRDRFRTALAGDALQIPLFHRKPAAVVVPLLELAGAPALLLTRRATTLTAHPGVESHFVSWSGDCSGSDSTAAVTMDADKTCIATFGHTWRVHLPLVTKNTPLTSGVQATR